MGKSGKKMDKANVIYGESHSQKLANWKNWDELEKVIRAHVGDKEKINLEKCKSTVKIAQTDSKLKDAYIKVGTVGNDLIMRIKAKKFLGDEEVDFILVTNYAQKEKAHGGSNVSGLNQDFGPYPDLSKIASDPPSAFPKILKALNNAGLSIDQLPNSADVIKTVTKYHTHCTNLKKALPTYEKISSDPKLNDKAMPLYAKFRRDPDFSREVTTWSFERIRIVERGGAKVVQRQRDLG